MEGNEGRFGDNRKYTVTFTIFGPRTDADLNKLLAAMDDFFTKYDARSVEETSIFGDAIKAEKAASKKWKEEP